ncbi:MAG: 5'-methylthioadenosine/S-adenosylhomocysteine nucleosidase [Ruminococcaceae bacterium]|nr:5'-methylthioadenosine/S-adenosylhomocysteine nucleosidase [Oscillospiraceae bacterium]
MVKNIGLVFADSMEYSPFLAYAGEKGGEEFKLRGNDAVTFTLDKGDRRLVVTGVKCGIGKVNAASATSFLISDRSAEYILNAGLSGAVSGLKREDMVAAESYVECDYDLTAIGYGLGVKPDGQEYILKADERLLSYAMQSKGIIKAKVGTGDIFLTDSVRKKLYLDTFGIGAFDMETAAIASVCEKCGVPMLSVRKISDDADDCSVEDYREMNDRQESCLTELLESIMLRLLGDDSQW